MRKLILFVLISVLLMYGVSFAGPEIFRHGANTLVDPVDGDGIGNRDYNDARYKDLQNVLTVAKLGGDYTTIQGAIDYAVATWAPFTEENQCVIKIAPGKYAEQIDSVQYINIIALNHPNPDDQPHDVILYNLGSNSTTYPLALGGVYNISGIEIATDDNGIFGELSNSYFKSCYFDGGHFIEGTSLAYIDFRYCTFVDDAFDLTGAGHGSFVALRHCDLFQGGTPVFGSTNGTIKFQYSMISDNVTISGGWSTICEHTEFYGGGKPFFNTTADIFMTSSLFPAGIHLTSNPAGVKTLVANSFKSDSNYIGVGVGDITADVTITDVECSGNIQYNGLDGEIQIVSNYKNVGSPYDNYRNIAEAIQASNSGDVIRVWPGLYNETLTLPAGIDLRGLSKNQSIIYSDTGTVITKTTGSSHLSNLTLRSTPVSGTVNAHLIDQSGGELDLRNVCLQINPTETYADAIELSGGSLDVNLCNLNYQNITSGGGPHRFVVVGEGASYCLSNSDVAMENVAAADAMAFLDSAVSSDTRTRIGDNRIHIYCSNIAYSGTAKAFNYSGGNAGGVHLANNHIHVTTGGTGTGYAYYIDSGGNIGEIDSTCNRIIVDDGANNYLAFVDVGDVLKSGADTITAADATHGTGSVEYDTSTLNDETRASFVEFDDDANSYIGKDKTYPAYFVFANDFTNFWLGHTGDRNIWFNYEKDADIFFGAGTGGDTDLYVQEGDANKTALNQEGLNFKVQSKVTNGGIQLEPDGTGVVKTVGKHEVSGDPTVGDGIGNRGYNDIRYLAQDMNAVPASDHTANGPKTNDINAGESVTIVDCVYLHSDGEWHKTDADAVATAEGMLAVSLETKTDGNAMNVAMPGSFVRDDSWTWTVGQEIYLALESGNMTQVAPSGTDDVVRILGHATHANRIFFRPEQTIVVHN